jgi:hypothetical protein
MMAGYNRPNNPSTTEVLFAYFAGCFRLVSSLGTGRRPYLDTSSLIASDKEEHSESI